MNNLRLKNMLDHIDSIPIDLEKFAKLCNVDKIYRYTELKKLPLETLPDIIPFIMLEMPTFGHYCCLIKKSDGYIFYEPYGYDIKTLFNLFPYSTLQFSYKEFLNKFGKIFKNTRQHQKKHMRGNLINTCSFHVSNRLRYSKLNNEEYDMFMNSVEMDKDNFVILTNMNVYLDLTTN